jgi:hypothetical protein
MGFVQGPQKLNDGSLITIYPGMIHWDFTVFESFTVMNRRSANMNIVASKLCFPRTPDCASILENDACLHSFYILLPSIRRCVTGREPIIHLRKPTRCQWQSQVMKVIPVGVGQRQNPRKATPTLLLPLNNQDTRINCQYRGEGRPHTHSPSKILLWPAPSSVRIFIWVNLKRWRIWVKIYVMNIWLWYVQHLLGNKHSTNVHKD